MTLTTKQEAELPLIDQLVLHYDTEQKTAKRAQASFKRVWKRLTPKVKTVLTRCWKEKTSVDIPGLPEELIEKRKIGLRKAPYLAVLESLPSTRMLSFNCSDSCALLWHGGVVPMMDAPTLDVFIAENLISVYMRSKNLFPKSETLLKALKKEANLDYTLLQAWGRCCRREISNLLDRQHPTRIMTPEIILLIKTGYKFPDLLDGEEETEERGDSDNPKRDNDVTVTYDPLADETHQDDDVSPEITRLLDQYEEPTEEEPPA